MKDSSKVPAIASIIILLLAIFGRWPYGFYTLLRLVVSLSAIYMAIKANKLGKPIWLWLMIGTALLFNPALPVQLIRSNWQALDVVALVVFGLSIPVVRERGAPKAMLLRNHAAFPRKVGRLLHRG